MSEPLLRWAGSKKKLLPILAKATPSSFTRYVEPFVGSGVLFLQVAPKKALLGDINFDLISTYETVRDHPRAVWNRVSKFDQDPSFYYALRETSTTNLPLLDRAARFVYLNRFCFNGVYRTNKEGRFNVARGKGHLFIPEYQVFKAFSKRLEDAKLVCGDFQKIVSKTRAGDFMYLDPPYALGAKRDRGEYGPGSFRDGDEERLAGALLSASNRGVKILLSYSPSQTLVHRLKDWRVHHLTVNRNVAGFSASRRTAQEILIANYDWQLN